MRFADQYDEDVVQRFIYRDDAARIKRLREEIADLLGPNVVAPRPGIDRGPFRVVRSVTVCWAATEALTQELPSYGELGVDPAPIDMDTRLCRIHREDVERLEHAATGAVGEELALPNPQVSDALRAGLDILEDRLADQPSQLQELAAGSAGERA